jgi:hypothetical protein
MKLRLSALFAKLRKTTINFIMSVRPSARVEQLGPQYGSTRHSIEVFTLNLIFDCF